MKILPNTQRLGKLTFDSNQVRKSSTNPNVLIAKASDGKDYSVVRKSDGSYDFAGSTRNLSLKDRLIMGINQESTPGDKLYSAASTLMAEPQRMMTRALTGNRYNTPGEIVANSKLPDGRLKNTLGLAADIVGDPTNLIGAGIGVKASKYLPKLFKSSKVISKVDNSIQPFKSEINWSKWNKEIPDNATLMKEYNAIEQQTKANGSWMKNPDGSKFTGTPEQFVQQNSENFKKAFSNPVLDDAGNVQYNYHGSPNKFEIFDKTKFNKGEFGKGIYTTTNKDIVLKGYAKPRGVKSDNVELGKDGYLYELYLNSKNPKVFDTMDDFLEHTNYSDITDFGKTMDDYLTLPELKEKYKETLKNYSFKNDEEVESFIANAFGRKNQMKSRAKLVMPDVDFIRFNDINLRPQVTPFHASYPKSAIGNNGMFDMTNPNIYKALIPAAIGTTASTMSNKDKNNKFKYGGKLLPLLNKF